MSKLLTTLEDNAQRADFSHWAMPWVQMIPEEQVVPASPIPEGAVVPVHPMYWEIGEYHEVVRDLWPDTEYGNSRIMYGLLLIYQRFNAAQRDEFATWVQPWLNRLNPADKTDVMQQLSQVYLEFKDTVTQPAFITWAQRSLVEVGRNEIAYVMVESLIPVYQNQSTEIFEQFVSQHLSSVPPDVRRFSYRSLFGSFIDRRYLRYMRALASLNADPTKTATRVQAVYETELDNFLPVYYVEDPLMLRQMANTGVTNAHSFDSIYPGEFEHLKARTAALGYSNAQSVRKYTMHNGTNSLVNYSTNVQVEDFIHYLDVEFVREQATVKIDGRELPATEAVSLVKQMLGLEPKTISTSGGFAPYLGHSMLYADPDSPKGDEVLGRVWFLMNHLVTEEQAAEAATDNTRLVALTRDLNNNRRSVVLAVLEAAELSGVGAATHCQTRMTGELLKLACWHLEGSKLRKLIAFKEELEVRSDADIELRIQAAPMKAKSIFETMQHSDTMNVKRLWEKHIESGTNPELFELYQAYYDDLYHRAPILGTDGKLTFDAHGRIQYAKDEHILERDNRGNMVSKYNYDGTLRRNATTGAEEPVIVYYQAEFAVLEHEFTKRMKAEFEEQRGLVY